MQKGGKKARQASSTFFTKKAVLQATFWTVFKLFLSKWWLFVEVSSVALIVKKEKNRTNIITKLKLHVPKKL